MEAELQTYEYQLGQVSEALQADPANEELTTLKAELENLISLTRSLIGDQGETSAAGGSSAAGSNKAAAADASRPVEGDTKTATAQTGAGGENKKAALSAGDDCLAKYKADNRYYPARITSVGGSKDDPVYSIVFKGYNNSEMVRSWEIKPLKSSSSHHTTSSSSSSPHASSSPHSTPGPSSSPHLPSGERKRPSHPALTPEEEAERERKKKRSEKKSERHETKTQVAQEKASSWQKFASKKKVAKKTGGQGSMFRTPEDPLAKVGVVGAGKGMTAYQDRSKHVYDS